MNNMTIYFDTDGQGFQTSYERCKPNEVMDFIPFYSQGKTILFCPDGVLLNQLPSKSHLFRNFDLDNQPKIEVNSMFGQAKIIIVLDDKTAAMFDRNSIL